MVGSTSEPPTALSFEVVNRPALARPIDIPSQSNAPHPGPSAPSPEITGAQTFDSGYPPSPPRREMPYPKGATPPSSPESGSSAQSTPPRSWPSPLSFGLSSSVARSEEDEIASPVESVYLSAWPSPVPSQISLPLARPTTTFASLPHEVHLNILSQLVEVRKVDFIDDIRGVNAGARAGLRDLVRLGRVSRAFLALSRDGQLWSNISTRILTPAVVRELLPRVSSGFLRTLDLERATGLTDAELGLTIDRAKGDEARTSISELKLAGCAMLSHTAIARAFIFSPLLQRLSLAGLQSVSAATMALLSPESCPHLTTLNVSRCTKLPASSLVHLVSSGKDGSPPSKLTTLEVAGLNGWAEGTLAALARGLPHLRQLDLSYSGVTLTDSVIGQAVSASRNLLGAVRIVRSAGAEEWRRVLPWRSLKLSSARGVTDAALGKLVGTLPQLEVLELADLRRLTAGRGLTALLSEAGGLPSLRKLDLEGCSGLEDGVLRALESPSGQSGAKLTHLVISNCITLTEGAIQSLVEHAPSLTALEADGTQITAEAVAHLLKMHRERRAREALISALDSPAVSTRYYRELSSQAQVRPRAAFVGYGAERMHFHRRSRSDDPDDTSAEAQMDEADLSRVTLRTYAGHLALDKADERRRRRRRRGELARESEERMARARVEREDEGDELRGLCTVS